MTLHSERINAVKQTREFLRSLLDPKLTPKIPKYIRKQAYACLRHYPWDMHLNDSESEQTFSILNKFGGE